jgi:ribose 5-phosphate isomerase RpiB
MSNASVLIAADHRGIRLKAKLAAWLKQNGYEATDLGTDSEERCDAFLSAAPATPWR